MPVLLIVCSAPLTNVTAETLSENEIIETGTAEFDLCYDFNVPGKTSKIKFVVVVPQTIRDKQRVMLKYSPKPPKIFRKHGHRYAEFIFKKPKKQFTIKISVKAKLFQYDLAIAESMQKRKLNKGPNFENYLKDERYIEKDDTKIQAITKTIKGADDLEIVENIYNYVIDNMEYSGYSKEALGAAKAVVQKKGDCTEYSHLFVALCRAKNIPARAISGYIIKFNKTPKHAWAEVYLQNYGWVPFDPTLGDKKNIHIRKKRFHNLEPIYVYRTSIHNDEIVNNSNTYGYWWWGDKVEVEYTVEFKKATKLPQQ